MPADLATINKILKEVYGFVTVEPKALADCPYKPGTEAHRDWISFNVIQKQTNPETDANQNARRVAETRLAKLKERYSHVKSIDPEIDALINRTPNIPIIKPAKTAHQIMIGEVNAAWEVTGLGPVDDFVTYLPQILSTPEWVERGKLFEILRFASNKNVEEVKQQRGIIFYAVMNPQRYSLTNLNPVSLSMYDQVQVQYIKYRR